MAIRVLVCAVMLVVGREVNAQLIDKTLAPNSMGEGIVKSLEQQIGADRGDSYTYDSSSYLIGRDPRRCSPTRSPLICGSCEHRRSPGRSRSGVE